MTISTSLAARPALTTLLAAAAGGAGPASGAGAPSGAASVRSARTTAAKAATASAKGAGTKQVGAKKTTPKSTTTKAGYAKGALPADYAFLRDPKLSLEEKLSRFIGLVMAKAENDLLAQMEKMAPGATAKAGTASGAGGTSSSGGAGAAGGAGGAGAAAPRKKKAFGLWSAVKVMLPAVGMAAGVLGDAATKKLVQQLSGPVLAAAATALGMPQLAPVALQAGRALGALATDDEKGAGAAVAALGGLAAGALTSAVEGGTAGASPKPGTAGSSGTGGGTGGGASGGATASGGTAARSEMADQLELQRLMERQKETFSVLSNILRMNHEARMASINNLR